MANTAKVTAPKTTLHLTIVPAKVILTVNGKAIEERELSFAAQIPEIQNEWDAMLATVRTSEAMMAAAGVPVSVRADKRTWPKELRV